jgi:very-short-patch-repair endonuclease
MSLRFASLDCLGKGAWKISASTPFVSSLALPIAAPVPVLKVTRTPRSGPTPHDLLWIAVKNFDGVVREHEGAVPGRKYRIDIAFPETRLAVEVDGWSFHGKHKGDFTRDRERQNLLTLNGWRILRFTAGQIRSDIGLCVEQIRTASKSW